MVEWIGDVLIKRLNIVCVFVTTLLFMMFPGPIWLAHLVGDYIIQTDYMGQGKKKSNLICFIHVITYLTPFIALGVSWQVLLLIGIQHYILDRSDLVVRFMKWKGSGDFVDPPFGPWSIVVTDNVLHIWWIYISVDIVTILTSKGFL